MKIIIFTLVVLAAGISHAKSNIVGTYINNGQTLVSNYAFATQNTPNETLNTSLVQSSKTLNFEAPITTFSEFGFSLLFQTSDNHSLGPVVSFLKEDGHYYEVQGQGVALTHNYYLNGLKSDGVVLSQTIGTYHFSFKEKNPNLNTSITAPENSLYLSARVGKQWLFENNMLFLLGLGVQYNSDVEATETNNTFSSTHKFMMRASTLTFDGNLSVGYIF